MNDDMLVEAHVVAAAFGWSLTRLRVWRHRNPDAIPVVDKGLHGVNRFRWGDARHAIATVVDPDEYTP